MKERRLAMSTKNKSILLSVLRLLPLLLCLVAMLLYFIFGEKVTVEELLNFAPDNPWLAAIFLIALYAFKSLAVFFPLLVLNILGGFMFSPPIALLVNTIGITVDLVIPYFIGKASGKKSAAAILDKHPKLKKVVDRQHKSSFFLSFLLRSISFLPGDAVSMFSGASGMPFVKYLLGSILGVLPGMILATVMGASINDPSSPAFWVSTLLTVLLSIISTVIYLIWSRKSKFKEKEKNEC